MADVIDFQTRRAAAPPPVAVLSGQATIIIFTGVRYERLDDDGGSEGNGRGDDRPRHRTAGSSLKRRKKG